LNKVFYAALAVFVAGISGCAQFTTSPEEQAVLELAAEKEAEAYIACVKGQAAEIYSTTDPAFIRDAVTSRCEDERKAFIAAEKESLNAKYMLVDKPLKESLTALDDRARIELAETLLARPATPANPQVARSATLAPVMVKAAGSAPASWNEQQRIYIDCMEDQADKYAGLSESAEAISDVAVMKCRDYLGVESVVALEREGRAVVMGRVMDKRLEAGQPRR
jgi:hypothetical protein